MSIIRLGSTKKFSDGWAAAFGKKKRSVRNAPSTKKKAARKAKKK